MFMRIVQQVNGLIMAQYIRASMWVKERLLHLANRLHASITLVFQNVRNLQLLNLLRVPTGSNTSHLRVSLTTAGQLIKAALMYVKAKAILLGSQLLTTVHQIRPPAPTASSPKKGRPAGITKSARSHTKGNKTAQTPTEVPLTQGGLKLLGRVKQLLQRVTQTFKKGQ